MKSLKELKASILSKNEIHEEKSKFILMKFKTNNSEDIDDRLNSVINDAKSIVSAKTDEIAVVLKCISDGNNKVDQDEIKNIAKREGFVFVDSSTEKFNESAEPYDFYEVLSDASDKIQLEFDEILKESNATKDLLGVKNYIAFLDEAIDDFKNELMDQLMNDSNMKDVNESDVDLQEVRVADGYLFATEKDVERASELNSSGRSFEYLGNGPLTKSNASKMAKLIKDEKKLLGRFEAIATKWNSKEVLMPFVNRIVELMPRSKYAAAFNFGKSDGQTSMSPNTAYHGDRVEKLLYNFGFKLGRQ